MDVVILAGLAADEALLSIAAHSGCGIDRLSRLL
jgi:hypothetical protein